MDLYRRKAHRLQRVQQGHAGMGQRVAPGMDPFSQDPGAGMEAPETAPAPVQALW